MAGKRAKGGATGHPTLFEMESVPSIPEDSQQKKDERPTEIPGILLGTSSFTAKGWEGTFYPPGMKSPEFLSFYAKQFRAVEIDSTFYGTPRPSTVTNWKEKTPANFVFALKVPQIVTHEKILGGCEKEFGE